MKRKDMIPMKKFMNNAGFTLVELIVVIAILGILAAVAVPAYSGYITKANQAADITTLDAIKTAAIAAEAKNGAVTAVKVTDAATDKVEVKVGTSTTYAAVGSDFTTYFTGDIKLKTGSVGEWTGGDWSISGNAYTPAG